MTPDDKTYNPPVDTDPAEAPTGTTPDTDLPNMSRPELQERPLSGDPLNPTTDTPRTGGMGGMPGTMSPAPAIGADTDGAGSAPTSELEDL
ncbi:hypothetical protein [uncultured Deinococcus sp.]|uniref:hypothetical protein n=1 Tax=uncultured Deinococcus sp. TaxID=158789 RepID=UPI00258490B5|nr:hypothetical protein [uncultured Deinococcus sp.]